jgi:heme oxygenase
LSARAFLREATSAGHERVDALYSALDLSDRGDYRLFLTGIAGAFLPIEAAAERGGAERLLPDWGARRRADMLRRDLAALGESVPALARVPDLASDAEILGAVYVLEGSRLGGAILRKSLPVNAPKDFLDADQVHGNWRNFLEKLDEALYEPALLYAAAGAANQAFACFQWAGERALKERFD